MMKWPTHPPSFGEALAPVVGQVPPCPGPGPLGTASAGLALTSIRTKPTPTVTANLRADIIISLFCLINRVAGFDIVEFSRSVTTAHTHVADVERADA